MSKHPIAAGKSSYDLIDTEKLFAALALPADAVLLDAACGVGFYSLAAAERLGSSGRLIAVDLWPEGIASLRSEAKERGLENLRAEVADLQELPVKDAEIDICLLATVLHDLVVEGTAAGALRELARVIKPGGRLEIIEFEKIEGPPGPPMAIRLDASAVEKLVTPYGFRLERQAVPIGPCNYLVGFVRS